jgi:hypothetical protein
VFASGVVDSDERAVISKNLSSCSAICRAGYCPGRGVAASASVVAGSGGGVEVNLFKVSSSIRFGASKSTGRPRSTDENIFPDYAILSR